ncbi:glycosyltransferase family 9 protein [Flagellimonas flava]|uniref:ADP-heptose:LPS heptosyltransferase n=1 Tax=Flagellimonas flava TaxID=570519 RepID=A0A1M5L2G7_9FLAO|nr:glycosyltransferase family 9 protein [Allomuricauda flava]SHG59181.1 ADP-heptose:LPS heptosyltransferase [Allomuricauda flava]
MDKKGKPVHILVIRLSAMGDVAMTIPVLDAVLEAYPEVRFTVLTKKHFAPIFSQLDRVSVHPAEVKIKHKGLIGLWRLYKELSKLKFDAVADLHNVLRSRILKKYFALDGVPFVQIDKGRKEKKALTRPSNKTFHQLRTTHQRYAYVFSELGCPISLEDSKSLVRLQLSKNVVKAVTQDAKKWVGIAPFAAHEGKMYPLKRMREVIETLNNTNKYKILLFGGGASEAAELSAIEASYNNVQNVAGKLNLTEELELISNLDVMLSMDSGNGHLAANYGIPVVTLWGVTHPFAGFAPFGQPKENVLVSDRNRFPLVPTSVYGNKLPKGYESVMESIPSQQVVDRLINILEN